MDTTTDRELDLVEVADVLWREWRIIVASTLALLCLALAYGFLAAPVYRTDLLVQVESSSDRASAGLLGDLSSIFDVKSSGDTEIEILRSRMILREAIQRSRYDIDVEPERFPLIGDLLSRGRVAPSAPGFLGMGGFTWAEESMDVLRFDVPPALEDPDGPGFTLEVLAGGRYRLDGEMLPNSLEGRFGVVERIATSAGPLTIEIAGSNASPGAVFNLRKLARDEVIADLQKRLQINEKGKQSGVISVALESARPARASRLLNEIGTAYVRQNGERKSEEARKSLAFLEGQLPELKEQLRASEDALLAFRDQHGAIDLGEEGRLELGQVVALQTRISLLQQERTAQLQQLLPAHPAVVAIDRQIGSVRQEIDAIQARIKALPDVEQELVRLTRDVKVNNELYLTVVNGMQQLRLARAGKVANVRVVDEPTTPRSPVKPMRALLAIGALIAGLMLGTCVAFLRSLFFASVTNPHDIEAMLGLPVYASVPSSSRQRKMDRQRGWQSHLVAAVEPDEPAVESLRSLRVALRLALLDAGGKVVVITGPTSGIGKSFVASNLAALIAGDDRKVLLVDGDLRRGKLDQRLELRNALGLSSVLDGTATLAEATQASRVPRLDVLTTGPKPQRPAELLQSSRLPAILAEAAGTYDLVLIDSAPLLPVSDSLVLVGLGTVNVLVARYGVTRPGELVEARKRVERAGSHIDGLLLNAVRRSASGARYGYGTYESYTSQST